MYSLFLSFALLTGSTGTLRVCADPDNMPFSNRLREGFENKIADLIAHDLNAKVEYVWWAQRRNFVRETLDAGRCDLIASISSSFSSVLTTKPYFRSSYMFVTRRDRGIHIGSLNDASLRTLRIGVHVLGENYAPPAHALAARGSATRLPVTRCFLRKGFCRQLKRGTSMSPLYGVHWLVTSRRIVSWHSN